MGFQLSRDAATGGGASAEDTADPVSKADSASGSSPVNERQLAGLQASGPQTSSSDAGSGTFNTRQRHGVGAPNTGESDNTVIPDTGGRDRATPAFTSAGTGGGPPIKTGEGGSPEPDPSVKEQLEKDVNEFMTNDEGEDVAETTDPDIDFTPDWADNPADKVTPDPPDVDGSGVGMLAAAVAVGAVLYLGAKGVSG